MLVLEGVEHDAPPSFAWRPLRVHTKAALPIEDYVVVAGRIGSASARQLTCIGGHVKPSPRRLLLLLPLPAVPTPPSGAPPIAPAIQVLEVGECAVHLLRDVKACFPSLVRRNPLAEEASDDDSDNNNSDEDEEDDAHERRQRTRHEREVQKRKREAAAAAASNSVSPAAAAFLAKTRVRVLPSLAAVREAYALNADATAAAIQRDLQRQSATDSVQFLCVEFPALSAAEAASAVEKELNFGVAFVHDRDAAAPQFLQIPLLREPHGFFRDQQNDAAKEEEETVFQDATVFTFATKRESSEHGGGKTSAETVKNIRLRHASGTFCTLVYPTATWEDVARKFSAALPQMRELRGELRSRRFMGVVPNRPGQILLED